MNYYERHLGDYAKDTAHLTMLEHGAYNLLLDRYYSTEAGIPADQTYRVGRARTKDEKLAVDAVLQEFFTLDGGIWIKGRVEEEITKAQTKIKAAQENGRKGGRPKTSKTGSDNGTKEKPTGFPMGTNSETQEKAHQTPDTRLQTPIPTTHTVNNSTGGTPAGKVCALMRAEGLQDANPSHPKLLTLLEAGMTDEELVTAAADAASKGKGFAYALGVAEGRRRDAAASASLPPSAGKPEKPWYIVWSGIEAKAAELGISKGDDELPPVFKVRVYQAAGVTEEMVRQANIDWSGK